MESINPSASESSAQIDSSGTEVLTEMSNKFDSEAAKKLVEQEKHHSDQDKTVKEVSPVTRVITDREGHVTIESEYFKTYRTLTERSDYDRKNPEDTKLGRAVWDIGFSSAMLDCDKDFKKSLERSDMDPSKMSPGTVELYKKAMKGVTALLEIADNNKKDDVLEQIEGTGQIGAFFVAMYELKQFDKENDKTPESNETETPPEDTRPETDSREIKERFDALERRFSTLIGDRGVDSEEVEGLYAEYSDLLKSVFDPETKEIIEERRSSLFSLIDQLAGINKLISSMDD